MTDDDMYDVLVEAHDLVFTIVYHAEDVPDADTQRTWLMRVQTILGSVVDVLERTFLEAQP